MRLEEAYSHCREIVRRDDWDRYLLCVLAPASYRPALLAIHAFNVEISRISETVSEPILGQIRLEWWREAIAALYGKGSTPPAHPVLEALGDVIARHHLPPEFFERLLRARERDMAEWRPATLQDLESYVSETAGEILVLSLVVLGEKDEAALILGRMTGIAFGLVGTLRAIAYQAHRRRFLLPQEVIDREGISLRDVFAFKQPNAALALGISTVGARAQALIAEVLHQQEKVSLPARTVLLEARIAAYHLKRLQTAGFNPFASRIGEKSGALLLWRLMGRRLLGRY